MTRKTMRRRVPAVLGAALLVLIAGRAAMASNTVPSTVSGYGAGAVTGADVRDVTYSLSADGTTIIAASLALVGNVAGDIVAVGFNAGAVSPCSVGGYDPGSNTTSAVCSGLAQNNAAVSTLAVVVH